ncbi:MAG: hypothetical protein ACKVPJ_06690 [Chitinophagales bacterium]
MKQSFTLAVFAFLLGMASCSSSSTKETNSTDSSENSDKMASSSDDGVMRKYQVKSGMYVTKSMNNPMGVAMENTTITTFDDYGKKEHTENISKVEMSGIKQETHSYSLMLGDMIYNWDAGSKTGTKYSITGMLDKNMDYEKLSDELKKQYKYEELGTETILGKECKKISVEVTPGAGAISHTYKGITMRTEASVGGMKMINEVTELQENITVDGEKFKVPSDVNFTEMKLPGGK